jgi:hypothetical protein
MGRNAFSLGWLLLLPLLLAAVPASVHAQGLDDLDDLDDLDEDVVTEKPFEPGIDAGKWEFIFHVGFLDLNKKLFGAENIIVDWQAEGRIYADMEIQGQNSFSPQFRMSRNWGHWGWQSTVGLTLGDFEQTVSDLVIRPEDGGAVFGENDAETGSYFQWYHDHSVVYNVLTKGRLIPFLSAGIGGQYYYMDSAYVFDNTSAFTVSYGGGLRIVADDLFSVVLEAKGYRQTLKWPSRSVFLQNVTDPERDDVLIDIPMTVLEEGVERPFTGFEEITLTNLWYSIGLVATF